MIHHTFHRQGGVIEATHPAGSARLPAQIISCQRQDQPQNNPAESAPDIHLHLPPRPDRRGFAVGQNIEQGPDIDIHLLDEAQPPGARPVFSM